MLRLRHLLLLAALMVDGGTTAPQPGPAGTDAGSGAAATNLSALDAGMLDAGSTTTAAGSSGLDAGLPLPKPIIINGIRWPEAPRLMTSLDARAIVAAHAAIQDLMAVNVKEDKRSAGQCGNSPKSMDVDIFEAENMYIVRINPRLDRCGWAHPSFNAGFPPDIYAVSPEGKILLRNPYIPYMR